MCTGVCGAVYVCDMCACECLSTCVWSHFPISKIIYLIEKLVIKTKMYILEKKIFSFLKEKHC